MISPIDGVSLNATCIHHNHISRSSHLQGLVNHQIVTRRGLDRKGTPEQTSALVKGSHVRRAVRSAHRITHVGNGKLGKFFKQCITHSVLMGIDGKSNG